VGERRCDSILGQSLAHSTTAQEIKAAPSTRPSLLLLPLLWGTAGPGAIQKTSEGVSEAPHPWGPLSPQRWSRARGVIFAPADVRRPRPFCLRYFLLSRRVGLGRLGADDAGSLVTWGHPLTCTTWWGHDPFEPSGRGVDDDAGWADPQRGCSDLGQGAREPATTRTRVRKPCWS
jgi:hypothetical protein